MVKNEMKIVSSENGDTPISGNFHWEDDDQPTVRGIPRFLNKPIWYHTAVKQLIIFRHLGSKQLSSLSKGITGTHVLLYKKMVARHVHSIASIKKSVYKYIYMHIFITIQSLCQSVKSHRGSTISPACHKRADSASPKLAPALSHCSCSPRGRTGWH